MSDGVGVLIVTAAAVVGGAWAERWPREAYSGERNFATDAM